MGEGGSKVHTTEEIADQFRKYYTSLYNLPLPLSGREKSLEQEAIRDYIQKSGLPRLPDEALKVLEEPL